LDNVDRRDVAVVLDGGTPVLGLVPLALVPLGVHDVLLFSSRSGLDKLVESDEAVPTLSSTRDPAGEGDLFEGGIGFEFLNSISSEVNLGAIGELSFAELNDLVLLAVVLYNSTEAVEEGLHVELGTSLEFKAANISDDSALQCLLNEI